MQIELVCVNIEINWNGDINLFLELLIGQIFELSIGNGGGFDNYMNICFMFVVIILINIGIGFFIGDFQFEGNWVDLIGSDINGNWILRVFDVFVFNDVGEFIFWFIFFNNNNDVIYSWVGNNLFCIDCLDFVVILIMIISYIVEINDSYGCVGMDMVLVGVVLDIFVLQVSCVVIGFGVLQFDWIVVGDFI